MAVERPPEVGTLQQTLLRLIRFWTDEGCLLLPSCDFEVDAATLHPATFFHLLGADPWRAATLQPVRRPLDGRRRDHPFRLAKHLQFQVVLKPPPEDLQEVYLRSLEAAGCELAVHDLRFADWRFESPALDARGAGWHVLVDGLGVTRITYLRELAGRRLEPPAVELTYGVERLSMVLAGASTAGDLTWAAAGPDDSALRRLDEAEFSRYVFEVADVDAVRQRLDALEREARSCLAAALARPAYELAVKALQGLEILEARGDLAAAERDRRLAVVREVVTAAAALHLDGEAENRLPGSRRRGRRERRGDLRGDLREPASGEPAAEETLEKTAKESPAERPAAAARKRRKRAAAVQKVRAEQGETADGGSVSCSRCAPRRCRRTSSGRRSASWRRGSSRTSWGAGSAPGDRHRGDPAAADGRPPGAAGPRAGPPAAELGPPRSEAYAEDGEPTEALRGFAERLGVDPEALEEVSRPSAAPTWRRSARSAGRPSPRS